MKYERMYTSGFGNDPRNKNWAVYLCEVCGHREDYHIPMPSTFLKADRRCPKCQALGFTDRRLQLQTELSSLEQQEAVLQKRRDEILAELTKLSSIIPTSKEVL